jgi:hypothetical protein
MWLGDKIDSILNKAISTERPRLVQRLEGWQAIIYKINKENTTK